MTAYIIRRLFFTVITVVIVSVALFVLLRLTPGDPVRNEFGLEVEEETYQARRHELGLDRPVVVQFVDWASRMFQGDFGRSIRARRPVLDEIKERLPATMELAVFAFALSVAIAVPLGVMTAVFPFSWFARLTTFFTLA
ncbi:MAG: ABC transporter permease, partial [Dehalococcoidia bacterium]